MSNLRFTFVPGKLVAAIAYFAQHNLPKLDKLKTVKLLYFADKEHLLRHGRPILGDEYFSMEHGPVPSFSKNIIDDTLDRSDADHELLKYVRVVPPSSEHSHPIFRSHEKADLGQLSASEREALDAVIHRYGQLSPWALRQQSHRDRCWAVSDQSKPAGAKRAAMPYELFFIDGDANAKAMLELAHEEQKERNLIEDFFR